jgi:hypothetical protein
VDVAFQIGHDALVTDADNGLVSHRGRWVLPMAGGEVTQVQVDHSFGLAIETYADEQASTHVRIHTAFEYEAAGVVHSIDPEHTADLAALVTLHKAVVEEGYAVKDGHLVVRFADGRAIRVAPHEQHESWSVTGRLPPVERRFSLIGLPGSGVALL